MIALLGLRNRTVPGDATHRTLQHPSTHWQLAVLQDAGSMLVALLVVPLLPGIAYNMLLGKGVPLHLQRAQIKKLCSSTLGG